MGSVSTYVRIPGRRRAPSGGGLAITGDNISLAFASTTPLANLCGMDSLNLVVTACSAGNLVLTVVQ